MDEARRRLPGLVRPTWIMAQTQTGGRGRQGRTWHAPEGHFAATLAMRPEGTAQQAAQRSFLMANALFQTLSLYVDHDRLAQKWPNDVLLDGGKVAGILLESAGTGGDVAWLTIGVGVNLGAAPADDGAAFKPVSLEQKIGRLIEPKAFLDRLASNYDTEERILARLGFSRIREAWLQNAARLGEVITARTARDEITGRFETLDANGNLILMVAGKPQMVAAAEIFF